MAPALGILQPPTECRQVSRDQVYDAGRLAQRFRLGIGDRLHRREDGRAVGCDRPMGDTAHRQNGTVRIGHSGLLASMKRPILAHRCSASINWLRSGSLPPV